MSRVPPKWPPVEVEQTSADGRLNASHGPLALGDQA